MSDVLLLKPTVRAPRAVVRALKPYLESGEPPPHLVLSAECLGCLFDGGLPLYDRLAMLRPVLTTLRRWIAAGGALTIVTPTGRPLEDALRAILLEVLPSARLVAGLVPVVLGGIDLLLDLADAGLTRLAHRHVIEAGEHSGAGAEAPPASG